MKKATCCSYSEVSRCNVLMMNLVVMWDACSEAWRRYLRHAPMLPALRMRTTVKDPRYGDFIRPPSANQLRRDRLLYLLKYHMHFPHERLTGCGLSRLWPIYINNVILRSSQATIRLTNYSFWCPMIQREAHTCCIPFGPWTMGCIVYNVYHVEHLIKLIFNQIKSKHLLAQQLRDKHLLTVYKTGEPDTKAPNTNSCPRTYVELKTL